MSLTVKPTPYAGAYLPETTLPSPLPKSVTTIVADYLPPGDIACYFDQNTTSEISYTDKCTLIFGKKIYKTKLNDDNCLEIIKLALEIPDYQIPAQPPKVHANIESNFQIPKSFWGRIKWLSGREKRAEIDPDYSNRMEIIKKNINIYKKYIESINSLIETASHFQPQTPLQLKNKLKVLWLLNHKSKPLFDYIDKTNKELKTYNRNYETHRTGYSGPLLEIFINCIGPLIRWFFAADFLPPLDFGLPLPKIQLKNIENLAKTPIKVGGFSIKDQEYEIRVYTSFNNTQEFNFYGHTVYGIYEKNSQDPLNFFGATIARSTSKGYFKYLDHNAEDRYSNDECYNGPQERSILNTFRFSRGTDYMSRQDDVLPTKKRKLDEKLVQIMVEVMIQNQMISMQADSVRDESFVLIAGGFTFSIREKATKGIINKILRYRAKNDDVDLYPVKNLGSHRTEIRLEQINDFNVYFGTNQRRRWADIPPILQPGTGVLPEYWGRVPNIKKDA